MARPASTPSSASALLAPLGGFLVGVGGGLAGMHLGLRKLLANPTDAAERVALRRFRLTMMLAVIGFPLALLWATNLASDWPALLIAGLMFLGFGYACAVWLPRILERRTDADAPLAGTVLLLQARLRQAQADSPDSGAFWRVASIALALLGVLAGLAIWYFG